jgi:DNA polymerase-3 subunit epsilon
MVMRLLSLELKRRWLARSAPEGPLRNLYEVPLPSSTQDWREVDFLAVDLETTGRDPLGHDIVSAGWVELRAGGIVLASAERRLVQPSRAMPEESAIIHAITDDEAAAGEPLPAVLAKLLESLTGRVLVAHYSPTETGFLDAACRRCFGTGLVVPVVDTLALARRQLERRKEAPERGALRLAALRERYDLPQYAMHDALGDALAAAELFLAQAEELSGGDPLPLGELLAGR